MFLEAFASDASLVNQSLAFHPGTFCQRLEIDAVLVSDLPKGQRTKVFDPPVVDEKKNNLAEKCMRSKDGPRHLLTWSGELGPAFA